MIYYIVLIILILGIIKSIISINSINKTIKLLETKFKHNNSSNLPNIIIVIPVLREQRIIKETLEFFSKLKYPKLYILIVTTEKEFEKKVKINTIDILNEIKNQYSKLKIIHQPKRDGLKSDQMNYAIDNFNKIFPELKPENTFFAFYDVDSRPNKDILNVFNEVYRKNKKVNIFQQSANYLTNFSEFDNKNFFEKYFLRSQALKQTRFSLAYEIPRIIRVYDYTSGRNKNLFNKITYAPTAGHGLFVRVEFLKRVKFPLNYTPEDMFWGFLVSSMNEPIIFIPSLDNSETPNSIKKVFFQLASWFKGPALVLRYKKYAKEHYRQFDSTRANFMSFFALYDSGIWLMTSFIVYLGIIGSIIFGFPILILFLLFLLLYQLSILIIANNCLKLTLTENIILLFFGIIIMMFHSIPAIYSLTSLLFKKPIYNKTER